LKAADQFEPGRRKCLACQRADSGAVQARARDRARDRALRRLGLEHLEAYRVLYRAERWAIPDTVSTDRARKRAVGRALRALERQHRPRYVELYQQELEQARSRSHPRRPGRPADTPDRLTIAPEVAPTWRRDGASRHRPRQQGEGAKERARRQAVRERAAELFAQGVPTSSVARQLGVARQTAVSWHARWRSGGAAALRNRRHGRQPVVPDSQLPAIEQALGKGAKAHGFDSDVWTSARVTVVVQRVSGVQLGSKAVQRLLRERLGWRLQPATSDGTVVTAAQPLATPASATDSLAAVAAAALADLEVLEDLPAGMPGPARSNPPASPTERRDAIAQAWRDEPGVTDSVLAERFRVSRQTIQREAQALQERGIQRPSMASRAERRDAIARAWRDGPGITNAALAERFRVSPRTIQRDIQALQEQGIQRDPVNRRRRSHRTLAQYAAVHRRFLAWLADELGRPPTPQDLSGDVLVRWIAQRATVGGPGGRGLSPPSLRQECSALRLLVRHAGRPELAASLHASRQHTPPPETISPDQYERLLAIPDPETPAGARDLAILRLLGDLGLRPGEVCALWLSDILWSADGRAPVQLRVAWGEGRVVPLTDQAASALVDWLARHPGWQPEGRRWELPVEMPLFVALGQPKTAGPAITEDRLLRQVLRHAQQAGVPAHLSYPSMLRHYWASQQVARGITPAQLQARGGWRDRRNTQAYFQRPPLRPP
jgi:integrase